MIIKGIFVVFFGFIMIGSSFAYSSDEVLSLNIPVKALLKEPTQAASSNFDIPLGIKITGKTSDNKWYKVKISYNFLGYYEYEGWIKAE